MRKPLNIDDVEELEFRSRTPDEHRAAADILLGWAAEPHPDDDEEVTQAHLLAEAGEQLHLAGDHEGAVAVFRRARTADGETFVDVRCLEHHELIEIGDVSGARNVAEEVRRSKLTDPDAFVLIAEDYEAAGDLPEANRWMNLALRRVITEFEDDEASDPRGIMVLSGRRRVRRALGFPPDEFDESPLLPPVIDPPE